MDKRGRPKKENKRSNIYTIRLTDEEVNMLEYLSIYSDLSSSEALRKGLKMMYNLEKSKH